MASNRLSRRMQRIYAIQALYAWDMYPEQQESLLKFFWTDTEEFPMYAFEMVKGVITHCSELDQQLSAALESWKIDRLQRVDRAILRMSVYAMRYCPDLPVAVIINEAVEIAKKFSGIESPSFINGILDTISQQRVVSHDEIKK